MNLIREHIFSGDRVLSDDDRRVLDIYGQLDGKNPSDDIDRRVLRNDFIRNESACYVLSIENMPIVGVARYKSRPDIGESYLQTLVIDEPFRRRKLGYGTIMVNFLLEQTKSDGNRLLSLDARSDAVNFYARRGFIQTTDDPNYPEMIKYVS